ncbi:MAG: uncharacterized protein KVP18_004927 [Porospora cf. gigantea A]|uniref:uncharacterized protein n=1 Tax=Porospora cf. gigantea A TaxID=2853593 RepID=UPI00355A338C|nr:MAG: hypothetical protein KVP18_004927 [Porospora cf. gigantea A]
MFDPTTSTSKLLTVSHNITPPHLCSVRFHSVSGLDSEKLRGSEKHLLLEVVMSSNFILKAPVRVTDGTTIETTAGLLLPCDANGRHAISFVLAVTSRCVPIFMSKISLAKGALTASPQKVVKWASEGKGRAALAIRVESPTPGRRDWYVGFHEMWTQSFTTPKLKQRMALFDFTAELAAGGKEPSDDTTDTERGPTMESAAAEKIAVEDLDFFAMQSTYDPRTIDTPVTDVEVEMNEWNKQWLNSEVEVVAVCRGPTNDIGCYARNACVAWGDYRYQAPATGRRSPTSIEKLMGCAMGESIWFSMHHENLDSGSLQPGMGLTARDFLKYRDPKRSKIRNPTQALRESRLKGGRLGRSQSRENLAPPRLDLRQTTRRVNSGGADTGRPSGRVTPNAEVGSGRHRRGMTGHVRVPTTRVCTPRVSPLAPPPRPHVETETPPKPAINLARPSARAHSVQPPATQQPSARRVRSHEVQPQQPSARRVRSHEVQPPSTEQPAAVKRIRSHEGGLKPPQLAAGTFQALPDPSIDRMALLKLDPRAEAQLKAQTYQLPTNYVSPVVKPATSTFKEFRQQALAGHARQVTRNIVGGNPTADESCLQLEWIEGINMEQVLAGSFIPNLNKRCTENSINPKIRMYNEEFSKRRLEEYNMATTYKADIERVERQLEAYHDANVPEAAQPVGAAITDSCAFFEQNVSLFNRRDQLEADIRRAKKNRQQEKQKKYDAYFKQWRKDPEAFPKLVMVYDPKAPSHLSDCPKDQFGRLHNPESDVEWPDDKDLNQCFVPPPKQLWDGRMHALAAKKDETHARDLKMEILRAEGTTNQDLLNIYRTLLKRWNVSTSMFLKVPPEMEPTLAEAVRYLKARSRQKLRTLNLETDDLECVEPCRKACRKSRRCVLRDMKALFYLFDERTKTFENLSQKSLQTLHLLHLDARRRAAEDGSWMEEANRLVNDAKYPIRYRELL